MRLTKNILADWRLSRRTVHTGPFRGTFVESYSEGVGKPKWLGTYERELHGVWEKVLERTPRRLFVIGAAEGYYACALLRLLPGARADAWEALERERGLIATNASRNGVSGRCDVHGFCDRDALREAIARTPPDLVIMDIEGGERDLLTADVLESLRGAVLVVETHGLDVLEGLRTLVSRTHDIEVIHPEPRTAADWTLPWYLHATPTLKHHAVQEHRVMPTPWIVAWPRRAPGDAGAGA